jgi:hypothetical protein
MPSGPASFKNFVIVAQRHFVERLSPVQQFAQTHSAESHVSVQARPDTNSRFSKMLEMRLPSH